MENEIKKLEQDLAGLKAKYEQSLKPKFEVGKWYKDTSNKSIFYLSEFNGIGKDCQTYGFNYNGDWMDAVTKGRKRIFGSSTIDNTILATPQEVQQALEKEAVKLYDGKRVRCLLCKNDIGKINYSNHSKYKYKAIVYDEAGFWIGEDSSNGNKRILVMRDGQWATPIKERSLEDMAELMYGLTKCNLINRFKKHKTELIEILTNLPNE